MISQTAEYALRAVVFLAMSDGKPNTTDQISKGTKVPTSYLSKVMQQLGRAHIVASQRGLGGGFTLAQRPDQLTVYDVINAVDPLKRIHSCPLELPGHGTVLCALHKQLDDAMMNVEEAFKSTTVEALLKNPTPSVPLCDGNGGADTGCALAPPKEP